MLSPPRMSYISSMPSFDVSSELNWHEMENAVHQATKEVVGRFDFRGIQVEYKLDKKLKTLSVTCSESDKLDAAVDLLQERMLKRGISLFFLDFKKSEPTSGRGAKKTATVLSGISKDKGKEIIKKLKETKLKIEAQLQDEQVRVSGKSRDLLQDAISYLKTEQDQLKVALTFGNFRD